jgi:hypothetical protein
VCVRVLFLWVYDCFPCMNVLWKSEHLEYLRVSSSRGCREIISNMYKQEQTKHHKHPPTTRIGDIVAHHPSHPPFETIKKSHRG